MALVGKFVADFAQFHAAVQKAETQLRSFESGSEKVEKQLNRMGDAFSGRKILQEAVLAAKAVEDIGGASKLTEAEQRRLNSTLTEALAKYKALGLEAPKSLIDMERATQRVVSATDKMAAGMAAMGVQGKKSFDNLQASDRMIAGMSAFGTVTQQTSGKLSSMDSIVSKLGATVIAAFSVRAIANFAKSIGDFAGEIIDLNAQTGISTDRLQAFNLAAVRVGLSLTDVTGAAEKLAQRVAGDDKSAAQALDRLGLSADRFKQLSLDQQLFEVSDGFSKVTNQSERTLLAVELFGKSGPRMLRLFQDGLKDTIVELEKVGPIIDKNMLLKADQLADRWELAKVQIMAGIVEAAEFYTKTWSAVKFIIPGFGNLGGIPGSAAAAEAARLAQKAMSPVTPASVETNTRQTTGVNYNEKLADSLDKVTAATIKTTSSTDKLVDAWATQVQRSKELTVPLQQLALGTVRVFDATGNWINQLRGNLPAAMQSAALSIEERLVPAVQMSHKALSELMLLPVALQGSQSISQYAEEASRSFGTFGDIVSDGFQKMFVGAISFKDGFLNIWKSLQAGVSNILTAILNDFTGRFLKGMLGAMSGRAGAMSGAFAGMLGGGAKAATGATGTAAAVGGGIGMGTAIAATGGIAAAALLAWAIAKKGLFRGGEEATKVSPARDQFINASGGVAKLAEQARLAGTNLDKLFAAQKVKDFESALAQLNAKLGEFAADQEADAVRLRTAIEKYGFAFEQLGPAFQRQELDAQAKELIEDWRVLVASGIDLGLVNEKLAGSVNDYLRMALKVGSEVPAAFRPVLQKMLEQGLLTDEAGVALTDLEGAGIHFAATMTEGFEKVVKKLDELIAKLVAAGTAIGNLPTDIKVPGAGTDAGDLNQGGGDWNGMGFAGGTRGRYLNFGAGTPVMLHGKERVMTEGEGSTDTGLLTAFNVLSAQIIQAMTTTALMARDQSMLARGRGASYA